MTTKEKIGIILGIFCFIPSMIIILLTINDHVFIVGISLLITQILFLEAFHLCTYEIRLKNKQLEKKLSDITKE